MYMMIFHMLYIVWPSGADAGIPLSLEAARVPRAELQRLVEIWQTQGSTFTLSDVFPCLPPAVVDPKLAKLLDDMASKLDIPCKPLPWFASMVVDNREQFVCTALCRQWGETVSCYPPEICVIVLSLQQPVEIRTIKGTLQLPTLPAFEDFRAGEFIEHTLLRPTYNLDEHSRDIREFGFQDDDELWVIQNLIYNGRQVTTCAPLVPLDEFSFGMTVRVRGSGGGTRRSKVVTLAVLEKLRERFPWLTEEDIKAAAGAAKPDGVDPHRKELRVNPDDIIEEVAKRIEADIRERRKEWEFVDEDVTTNFYVHIAGGVWTDTFCGESTNEAVYKARGHVLSTFNTLYDWPRSKGFRFRLYGVDGANFLAREWCRKSHYFFNLWLDTERADCFDVGVFDYVEHEEFLDWAVGIDISSPTWARISEVRAAFPTLLIIKVDKP